jgi:H+/Cl- antiporter ClcA
MRTINELMGFLGVLFAIGVMVAKVLIAMGLYQDALQRQVGGRRLLFFSPAVWALVGLFCSIPAVAVYWAAHHSTLAQPSEAA